MSTAAGILTGLFFILLGIGYLGVALPPVLLAIVAILAGIAVLVAGWPYGVRQ